MAPQVKKAKTAFLFFQSEKLSSIRKELNLSMGDAMTELASRWRVMDDDSKQHYLDLEAEERARFGRESAQADAERLKVQEARRNALTVQDGENSRSRGARQRIDSERSAKNQERRRRKAQREAELSDDEIEERRHQKELKRKETQERQQKRQEEESAVNKQHKKLNKEEQKKTASRLDYLFKESSIFARLKTGKGGLHDEAPPEVEEKKKKAGRSKKDAKKPRDDDSDFEENGEEEEEEEEQHVFLTKQPNCIKFGQLKPYQVESLNWMIHLAEKGLNGILADEMGLGKTLQSISILAYHWEYLKIQGPHLVCVPKSTLSNWMNEFKRWCPSLRVIRFHGAREDRETMVQNCFTNEAAAHDGKRPERQVMNEKGELVDDNSENPRPWDVCVTTYEVCNAEKKTLQKFAWKYLIIDEAHRLKNDASMFSQTVRSFRTFNRLLLTGTPLQNNLRELWALLNFLLPDIFSSAEQFDEWFDLDIDDEEAKKSMISQLHKILRPFMLRRLKADVAKGLPPKTETIIMVGMSKMQKQLYKQLLLRDLDSIAGNSGKNRTAVLNIVMQLRKCCGHPYLFEGVEDRTLDPLGQHLVDNCGKLFMVDKLLKKLKERDSRVLIFTQMTRVLDILEDFMVMRGYQYCRIDGNTNHDDRENAIDTFNAPNSEKFCFILSTRAGGLGINLQTADICILYDSDWNPQQDLQAQDRCHRLGQKKPVSIYRLVSENTIEEKIVERAQQKLKLDAMVVQQGRLKEKDKISKDEMMAAVRFGADTVFRSEESTITDDDIDVILERGKAKTKELAEKIQKAEKGDLLDFRLDGGVSAQTFEGIDYSDKDLRDQLRLLAANSIGKRERKPPPMNYNPIMQPKKSMVVNNERIKLPRNLRLPTMEDHHFYNRERLLELDQLEFETYATLREAGKLPPREITDNARTLLPDEIGREKVELLDEGFGKWSRSQYFLFVKACAKYGREDITGIAAEMDMPIEEVRPYSAAFWAYGATELKDEWERVVGTIEKGEKKIAKQKKLTGLLTEFVSKFDNPRVEMAFANKGTTHFSLEQDRALLCAVDKVGYGNWDLVREEIRKDDRIKFQHTVQGMTTAMIAKRVDYRMRQTERELEAREKTLKNKKPSTVIAAEKVLDSIKAMDAWETEARNLELRGEDPPPLMNLPEDAAQIIQERLIERQPCVARLQEIEAQVARCMEVAEETRQGILRGDQYVNYSNITLRSGTSSATAKSELPKEIENGEIEARINKAVLRVPECGQCSHCIEKSEQRKLCEKRLAVRAELIEEEVSKLFKAAGIDRKKLKKRKADAITGVEAAAKKIRTSLSTVAASAKKSPKPKTPKTPKAPKAPKTPSTESKEGNAAAAAAAAAAADIAAGRVASQGNKRMAIPDDLFPGFCRRIGAEGTGERMKLINQFAEEHPSISVRQVTIRLGEITTRHCPGCIPKPAKKGGRAFMFYLRPRFYKHLAPENRPADWERYAEEDDVVWKKEQADIRAGKKVDKRRKKAPNPAPPGGLSQSTNGSENDSGGGSSVAGDDDSGTVGTSGTSNVSGADSDGDGGVDVGGDSDAGSIADSDADSVVDSDVDSGVASGADSDVDSHDDVHMDGDETEDEG